jgi:uncharacterized repeat protein (TIGR01451 family)
MPKPKQHKIMRKLFCFLVLFSIVAKAQIVNIPDTNFKAALLLANADNNIAKTADNIAFTLDANADGEIQESEAMNVVLLDVSGFSIADLTGFVSFQNVVQLTCDYNNLTSVDFSSMINLKFVSLANNSLTAINITGMISLVDLNCNNNFLTVLDTVTNPNLWSVQLNNNLLTSLDFSSNPVSYVGANQNPLGYLNIKNGVDLTYISLINTPTPHICIDDTDNEINMLNQLGNTLGFGFIASPYCTFIPGGNYNTITGTVTFDADNNGCDSNDSAFPNIRVNINNNSATNAGFTDNNITFINYTQTGSYNITPVLENSGWFTITPDIATVVFSDTNNNIATQNFCIAANGIHPDVEVVIAPIFRARPGFDAVYQVVYKNKGNIALSGNLIFSYDDTALDYVSGTVSPIMESTGMLNYNYTNLMPFENRSIYITMHVNAPIVNIGDQLNFTATITPGEGDEILSDNTFHFNQTVVGSLDPNEITCIEGNSVSPTEIGNYLHYVINFQNTGTADAENIVVKDIIDTNQFDVNSLQLMNSSAPVTARLTGNVAEFIFQNISLHSGGHGNILIKVKSKNTLVQGDTVNKQASIYFDYNAAVDTNMENTTFQTLSTTGQELDASISIYPNPTQRNIIINCNNNIKSIQLFDVQGRLLQTDIVNETSKVIDVSSKAKGVYFLKILSDKGSKVEKIVKD